jgi:hypothetical protein
VVQKRSPVEIAQEAHAAAVRRNREWFPFAYAKQRELREWFPEAAVVYARENGREVVAGRALSVPHGT